jgi:hypothetical protein
VPKTKPLISVVDDDESRLFERRSVSTIDLPHRDRVLLPTTNSTSPMLNCPRTALRDDGDRVASPPDGFRKDNTDHSDHSVP